MAPLGAVAGMLTRLEQLLAELDLQGQEIIVRILERGKFEMRDNNGPNGQAPETASSNDGAGGI